MSQPLVSLISPCYNTAKYIRRLLDSVLEQSYQNIEMFVVDDGSTDDSLSVVKSYVDPFRKKGYALTVIEQPNSGQSVAIQNALDYIHGTYLAWPDSDDFYAQKDAIEKMVQALEVAAENVAVVRVQEQCLDENDLHCVCVNGSNCSGLEPSTLFEDCLFGKKEFYFPPGGYMVKVASLIASSKWPMYTSKNAGQNWQLYLPLFWNYRCITIPEVLYSVLIRGNSHSRGQYVGYDKTVAKLEAYSATILGTLDRIVGMDANRRDAYKKQILEAYGNKLLFLAFKFGKNKDFFKYKKLVPSTKKIILMNFLVKFHLSSFAVKCSSFAKALCKNKG